jgi:hypothetical protein
MTTKADVEQLFYASVEQALIRERPDLRTILRVASPAPSRLAPTTEDRTMATETPDWARTLELIQRASQVMDETREHASALEARTESIFTEAAAKLEQARKQIDHSMQLADEATARADAAEKRALEAEAKLKVAEQEVRDALARARHAENQAREAGEWLARLNDSITDAFASRLNQATQRKKDDQRPAPEQGRSMKGLEQPARRASNA